MNLSPGIVYNIRLGSSEYPVDTLGRYIGPSDLARFHKFESIQGVTLTIHESNIEFHMQEAARAKAAGNETPRS
jgi:hypothetical protein